jgi:hypothetical protein
MNSSASSSVSGVARWAGVAARAISSANEAGELIWSARAPSGPACMVWGTFIGTA